MSASAPKATVGNRGARAPVRHYANRATSAAMPSRVPRQCACRWTVVHQAKRAFTSINIGSRTWENC